MEVGEIKMSKIKMSIRDIEGIIFNNFEYLFISKMNFPMSAVSLLPVHFSDIWGSAEMASRRLKRVQKLIKLGKSVSDPDRIPDALIEVDVDLYHICYHYRDGQRKMAKILNRFGANDISQKNCETNESVLEKDINHEVALKNFVALFSKTKLSGEDVQRLSANLTDSWELVTMVAANIRKINKLIEADKSGENTLDQTKIVNILADINTELYQIDILYKSGRKELGKALNERKRLSRALDDLYTD